MRVVRQLRWPVVSNYRRQAGALLIALLSLAGSLPVSAQPEDPQERADLRDFLEQTITDADSFEDRYDAEVWLVDMSGRLARFVEDPEEHHLQHHLQFRAKPCGVPGIASRDSFLQAHLRQPRIDQATGFPVR